MLLGFHKGKRHSRLKKFADQAKAKAKGLESELKERFERWLLVSVFARQVIFQALLVQRSEASTSHFCLFKSII